MTDIKVLSREATRKLAEDIAKDLFTSGSRHYSHLSLNDAAELGWCEKAVADRAEEIILRMMDAYEEPVPKDQNRCAVCGWPLKEKMEDGCVRGNCSQRPRPKNLYDPERAELESSNKPPRKEALAELARQEQSDGHYNCNPPTPKWEPGMWAQFHNRVVVSQPVTFQVSTVKGGWLQDHRGQGFGMDWCKPIPPPKEEKPAQERQAMPSESDARRQPDDTIAVTGASPSGVNETGGIEVSLKWFQEVIRILRSMGRDDLVDGEDHRAVETSEKPYWNSQVLCDVSATLNAAMERTADLNRRLKNLEVKYG